MWFAELPGSTGGGKGRSGRSLLHLRCVYCQIFSANTCAIGKMFGKYSQISVAEACTSFSEELILNVIPAHVIASICVALTDDLRVKA